MQTKLAMINYYYTEMTMLHEEGGAFYRPLFFDFPDDDKAYDNVTNNVMLGDHLKVSQQHLDQDETDYYFPEGTWCSVMNISSPCIKGPETVMLPSRLYQSWVHIRDGGIVPLQTGLIGPEIKTRTT